MAKVRFTYAKHDDQGVEIGFEWEDGEDVFLFTDQQLYDALRNYKG